MTEQPKDGGPAFPIAIPHEFHAAYTGMSVRDWFIGQALSNPAICTGAALDWQLEAWFGKTASGITRTQIIAAQATYAADAVLDVRTKATDAS